MNAGKSPAREKQRETQRLRQAKSFGDFAETWFSKAPMADSTRAKQRAIYDRDVGPQWKNRLLSELLPDDRRAHCGRIVDRGAPATAIHVRDIVKQTFGFAHRATCRMPCRQRPSRRPSPIRLADGHWCGEGPPAPRQQCRSVRSKLDEAQASQMLTGGPDARSSLTADQALNVSYLAGIGAGMTMNADQGISRPARSRSNSA